MATTPTQTEFAPSRVHISAEPASDPPVARTARLVYVVAFLGVAFILLVGSVPLEAGRDAGQRLRISAIWAQMTPLLERRGLPEAVVILFWLAVAVALLASAWACWLALSVRDEPDGDNADLVANELGGRP